MKLCTLIHLFLLTFLIQSNEMQAGNAVSSVTNIPLHELGKLKATPQNFKFVVKCLAVTHVDVAQLFIKKINAGLMVPEGNAYTILKEWNLIQHNGLMSKYWAQAKEVLDKYESNNQRLTFKESLLCMKYPTRNEICSLLKINYISPTVNNLSLILKIMPLITTETLFTYFALFKLKNMIKGDIPSFSMLEQNILKSWTFINDEGYLNTAWIEAFREFDWDQL